MDCSLGERKGQGRVRLCWSGSKRMDRAPPGDHQAGVPHAGRRHNHGRRERCHRDEAAEAQWGGGRARAATLHVAGRQGQRLEGLAGWAVSPPAKVG